MHHSSFRECIAKGSDTTWKTFRRVLRVKHFETSTWSGSDVVALETVVANRRVMAIFAAHMALQRAMTMTTTAAIRATTTSACAWSS